MTTNIEQEFFEVFGIEPEYYCTYENVANNKLEYECTDNNLEKCKECKEVGKRYPEITSDILLQLIYIMANGKYGDRHFELFTAFNDEWFAVLKDKYNVALCAGIDITPKNAILKLCIYRGDIEEFKNEVKSLFEEGAEDDGN